MVPLATGWPELVRLVYPVVRIPATEEGSFGPVFLQAGAGKTPTAAIIALSHLPHLLN